MRIQKIAAFLISAAMMMTMTACDSKATVQPAASMPEQDVQSEPPIQDTAAPLDIPLKLDEIPADYLESSSQPGRVVRIEYDTNTYDDENRDMHKYAYVYLPYGYDETDEGTFYNIFYLMHGWTGDAELYLGGEDGDRPLKRILDNLIANGDMEPMLVVTPTYYQDNQEKGPSVAVEDSALTANFYHELLNDLMPAVESTYHTYAQSTDDAGLRSAREHRIFGGFSMGSVTTWYSFLYGLDYFKYFMPISGDCWVISQTAMGASEQTAEETAKYLSDYVQGSGYTQDDFAIYALTGTNDTAQPALSRQIEAMKNYPESFAYSENAGQGNLFFQVAEGGVHNYTSMIRYIYNALPVFEAKINYEGN